MVENVDEEEEVDTAVNIIHPKRQIQKTTKYEPKFQGNRYEDDAVSMLLKYGDILGPTRTE